MGRPANTNSALTEARIKEAAYRVFLRKGFAATTVRDLAKESGTNVALLNYYFRNKKNLFNVVVLEGVKNLLSKLAPILHEETTTIEQKIHGIVDAYIEFLLENPDLPSFILNEVRKKNFEFVAYAGVKKLIHKTHFMKQLKEVSRNTNPVHFFISMFGMIIFPFVAKPVMVQTGLVREKDFRKMMLERRKLIPLWVSVMLKAK